MVQIALDNSDLLEVSTLLITAKHFETDQLYKQFALSLRVQLNLKKNRKKTNKQCSHIAHVSVI